MFNFTKPVFQSGRTILYSTSDILEFQLLHILNSIWFY